MATPPGPADQGFKPHVIAGLALALIPAFAGTAMFARAYKAEQRSLAGDWLRRGEAAMEQHRPADAVEAFRTAQTYARHDRSLRLRLALALGASGRTSEARAYLMTLWSTQPGNGPVNLALGRLAAQEGDISSALRFYHNAIEGAWTDRAEEQRRTARLELASFLVGGGVLDQAQAELIALAGDPPSDTPGLMRMARLMGDAGLTGRALAQYRDLLRRDPQDRDALTAAGALSYRSHNYAAAAAYLSSAVSAGEDGDAAVDMLRVARLVLASDPYQRRLPLRERTARAGRAFEAAQARVTACLAASREDTRFAALGDEAAQLSPVGSRLGRDPDALDEVMELVFRIEEATAACPDPSDLDRALGLLAASRQNVEQ